MQELIGREWKLQRVEMLMMNTKTLAYLPTYVSSKKNACNNTDIN